MSEPASRKRQDDIAILITGVTGSGKSSFISALTEKGARVGHSLESCTTSVSEYTFQLANGQRVHLIDTPGFDDTHRSNAELLQEISSVLCTMYQKKERLNLAGLIYLHRITDHRVAGSSLKSLRIFENLCGPACFPNVVLVSTMWDLLGNEGKVGEAREKTLMENENFWGKMVKGGATVMRHPRSKSSIRDSAYAIVDSIARKGTSVATNIQREMVDEGKELGETMVGRFVLEDLFEIKRRYETDLGDLQEALSEALQEEDKEMVATIAEQKEECEKLLQRTSDEQKMLNARPKVKQKQKTSYITTLPAKPRHSEAGQSKKRIPVSEVQQSPRRAERKSEEPKLELPKEKPGKRDKEPRKAKHSEELANRVPSSPQISPAVQTIQRPSTIPQQATQQRKSSKHSSERSSRHQAEQEIPMSIHAEPRDATLDVERNNYPPANEHPQHTPTMVPPSPSIEQTPYPYYMYQTPGSNATSPYFPSAEPSAGNGQFKIKYGNQSFTLATEPLGPPRSVPQPRKSPYS